MLLVVEAAPLRAEAMPLHVEVMPLHVVTKQLLPKLTLEGELLHILLFIN